MKEVQIEEMIGAKILSVRESKELHSEIMVTVKTDKGNFYFIHEQDCCESVWLEDGLEDLKKMIGETILMAECVIDENNDYKRDYEYEEDYHTWTFYKLASVNHDVCLRFLGISNGYSESVDIYKED